MKKPILIVGGGIAGLSIAVRLEERGIPFELIDSGINHCSKVAAGMINPMVFRRMLHSWRVQEFLPETIAFYKTLADWTGENYLKPLALRRVFAHEQEYDLWSSKQDDPAYSPYLKKINSEDMNNDSVINTFGTGMVNQAYYVSTKQLLIDLQQKYKAEERLREEKIAYADIDAENATYKRVAYENIIFCEGSHVLENPWFNYLPLQGTKGELLTVESDELNEFESINRKCFAMPLGNKQFKVGATYAWNTTEAICTAEAKKELLNHLATLTKAQVRVVNHEAGIRPTVPDRRPLLGRHPNFPKLSIFNGLGAKGFLLAPTLSKEFLDHLLQEDTLDKEVDIQRYAKFLIQD